MPADSLSRVFEHLRQTLRLPDEESLTDSELLTRFISNRDQAAFAALFRRHSRMVLTVCRRVLGHAYDAEDALQATFLVLARKAKSLVKREALGSFLYKVAYRTALEAKTIHDRRKKREKLMDNMPPIGVPPDEVQDWHPLLYRELNRLPERYREPIVLCDLEGQTRKQVAIQLKISEGTLSSLLSRGREMLAQRLARRGVSLSAVAIAMTLSEEVLAAQMIPASLMIETTKTATLMAAGKMAAVSSPAVILMKGVLKAMFLTKLKIVTGLLVVMGVLGAGGFAYRSGSDLQANPPDNEILRELKALRKEVELLKMNLQIVVEKVHTQESEIHQLKGRGVAGAGQIDKPLTRVAPPARVRDRAVDALRWERQQRQQQADRAAAEEALRKRVMEMEKEAQARLKALQEAERAANEALRKRAMEIEKAAREKLNALEKRQDMRQTDRVPQTPPEKERTIQNQVQEREKAILRKIQHQMREKERTIQRQMQAKQELIERAERDIQNALQILENTSDKQTRQRALEMLQRAIKKLDKLRDSK